MGVNHTIKNDVICVDINSLGAELQSIKTLDGKDYLWNGNEKYWVRKSPTLFPFVGRLKNFKYTYQGKEYPSEPHGFTKVSEFTLLEKKESEIWFELRDNEETYKIYPFHFSLKIGYKLEGNSVQVCWKVENLDQNQEMYFSIGAHPGFFCPFDSEGEEKEGYFLEFKGCGESLTYYFANYDTGLVIDEPHTMQLENGRVKITKDFFDESSYIFEDKQVTEVSLVTPTGKKYVSVSFDMPILAVWSPEKKNAPFICLEPWYGRCDGEWFEGSLEEREWNNVLKGGEIFENTYTISVFSDNV